MKKIFTLVLCLSALFVNAQTFTTSLTSQPWAGGICCISGVDYSLTIKGSATALDKLTVKAVCIDGLYFDRIVSSVTVKTGSSAYRTFTFSYSADERRSHDLPDKTTTENPFPTCTSEGRIYLEGNEFLMVESRKELFFLAYP